MSPELLLQKAPEATTQNTSDLEIIMRAAQVQEKVRSRLWFKKGATIDSLYESGITNCSGYAIVGSEELEKQGIPHFVGMANTHAATYVVTSSDIWLFDILSPELSKPITQDINYFDDTNKDRILARLNARNITFATEGDYMSILSENEWLSIRKDFDARGRAEGQYARHCQSLVLALFTPKLGRAMVYQRQKFVDAHESGDVIGAANALLNMKGQFPDLDLRTETPECVKTTVKRLSSRGSYVMARKVTDAYFESFQGISDSRVKEYQADCLRYIAKFSRQGNLAQRAIKLYESTMHNPKSYRSSIKAKIDLCAPLTKESI